MYQNYIFDLYGTLVDIHTEEEKEIVWEKLSFFYGYYGASYQPKELKEAYVRLVSLAEEKQEISLYGKSYDSHEGNPEIQIEKVFEALFTEKNRKPEHHLIVYAGQFFRILTTEYICLYQGVIDMLEKLQKKGKNIYLLSNAQRIFTEYELVMLDIAKYFDGIMISSDYGVKKPDIKFFELLIKKYQLEPKKSIMIGNDEICDIMGGNRAGFDTYYIHSNLSKSDTNIQKGDAVYMQMEMDIDRLCSVLRI